MLPLSMSLSLSFVDGFFNKDVFNGIKNDFFELLG